MVRSILIVEDEELVRDMVVLACRTNGFHVETASDGRQAIELFAKASGRFSAILLDMNLPVLNGPQTFSRLRSINPDVPVIVMTGYDKDLVDSLDADAVLSKPFKFNELFAVLEEVGLATA